MRRSKLIIVGAAIALLMAGCSLANSQNTPEPVEPAATSQEAEENAKTNGNVLLTTGVKSAGEYRDVGVISYPAESPKVILSATGNAEVMGLDPAIFSVDAGKGDATNNPVLNNTSAGDLRLFSKPDTGNGNFIDVSVTSAYSITSISIVFKENENVATIFKPGATDLEPVEKVEGSYPIDAPMFRIQNTLSSGSTKTLVITSITINYEGIAKQIAAGLPTQLSLSYTYEKEESGASFTINKAVTGASNSYIDWEQTSSGITYSGNSSGGKSSVQLRDNSGSGIVTSGNLYNSEAKRIRIKWTVDTGNNDKTVDIYGKNVAYSGASDLFNNSTRGTFIKSVSYADKDENDEEIVEIGTIYKYIGIRSSSGATYLASIDFEWNTYEYSDVAIRFGNFMKKSLWVALDSESPIQGYGVMLSTSDYLRTETIKDKYEDVLVGDAFDDAIDDICESGHIKNFYTSLASKEHPDLATEEQKGTLDGDYYIWNLYKSVATANITKTYAAAAYIRVADEIIFLTQESASVKSLAGDLIGPGGGYEADAFDGTLNHLANYEVAA